MGTTNWEIVRTVSAPIEEVFARLSDIEGHNEWMPQDGSSIRSRSEKTSPGETGLGTTYVDYTKFGATPGEIAVFEPPTRLVYHWQDSTRAGRVSMEGWLDYTLEAQGDRATVVRHSVRLAAHRFYNVVLPVFSVVAKRERKVVLLGLARSFEDLD